MHQADMHQVEGYASALEPDAVTLCLWAQARGYAPREWEAFYADALKELPPQLHHRCITALAQVNPGPNGAVLWVSPTVCHVEDAPVPLDSSMHMIDKRFHYFFLRGDRSGWWST